MRWVAFVLLLSCSACTFFRRSTASVDDYAAYRRFRLAEEKAERLTFGYEYLTAYPGGRFRSEVRREYAAAEREYLAESWDDAVALRAFARGKPLSSKARAAVRRAEELELSSAYRRAARRAFDERVTRLEEGLKAAEQGRRELLTGISTWVERLVDIPWGAGNATLSPELDAAFYAEAPPARCAEGVCEKTLLVGYAVPEGGRQSSRQAIYDVTLALSAGVVRSAALGGPELFSRVGEAVQMRPVSPTDYAARAEALARAVELVATAVESRLPQSECHVESVSPVLLRRRCRGIELTMVAATELGEEDRIVVGPGVEAGSEGVPR